MDHTPQQSIRPLMVLLLVAAMVLPLAATAVCQEKSATSDEVITINSDLVVVDAEVVDKKTRQRIGNLKREDFALYDDGVKQDITYFSQDKLPLSIVLLLDLSGSVKPIIEQISNGALDALQRLKPEDEVALMAFADEVELVQDFTRDRQLMSGKIANVGKTSNVGTGTLLNKAVYEAAREMPHASNPASRRVIIVVTDNIAFSPKGEEGKKTFAELFETGSVVSGLIVRGGFGKTVNILFLGQLHGLNPYAERTGGEIMNADKKEVETKLAELFDHLRTRYSFGYRPSSAVVPGVFHRLEIMLTPAAAAAKPKKGVQINVKEGYYAQKRRAG